MAPKAVKNEITDGFVSPESQASTPNIFTQDNPSDNIADIISVLEAKMMQAMRNFIKQALESLREHIEVELHAIRKDMGTLNGRVTSLESERSPTRADLRPELQTPIHNPHEMTSIQNLESRLNMLVTKHEESERKEDRDKRKCNILIGNLDEETGEMLSNKVRDLFSDVLHVDCCPMQVMRLGKPTTDKKRMVLVKMDSPSNKIKVLIAAKHLRGSNIYIREDLSMEERKKRSILVTMMKKARSEGKKAYIRFYDGNLIIDGSVVEVTPTPAIQPVNQ